MKKKFMNPKRSKRIRKIVLTAVAVLLALIALAPYYWSILISFRPQSEIYTNRSWFFTSFTFEHYKNVFENVPMFQYFFNTLF